MSNVLHTVSGTSCSASCYAGCQKPEGNCDLIITTRAHMAGTYRCPSPPLPSQIHGGTKSCQPFLTAPCVRTPTSHSYPVWSIDDATLVFCHTNVCLWVSSSKTCSGTPFLLGLNVAVSERHSRPPSRYITCLQSVSRVRSSVRAHCLLRSLLLHHGTHCPPRDRDSRCSTPHDSTGIPSFGFPGKLTYLCPFPPPKQGIVILLSILKAGAAQMHTDLMLVPRKAQTDGRG